MIALAEAPRETGRSIEELTQTVSASRLSTWQRCRLQFFFRYLEGISRPPNPALHIGTTVHAVLQQWSLARWRKQMLTTESLKEVFQAAWNSPRDEIEWQDEEEKSRLAAWSLLEAYFRETPIPPDERPEGVEVSVEADLGKHGLPTLIGVIDLVRAGGRIVDYKTAARSPVAEMLAHTSETQVTAYSVLYREATDLRESGVELHHLIKTKSPKVIVTEFPASSDEQVQRLYRVIESYVSGLEREDFTPSPGLQCGSCEFFAECRAWH